MAEAARDLYRGPAPLDRGEGGINKAEAYYALLTHPRLSLAAKAVAAVLIDHHNRVTGRCDPGIARIVARARIARRSVFRALDELETAGLIVRARHGGGANRNAYLVVWDALAPASVDNPECAGEGCQDWHLGGARDGTERVPGLAPKPVKEPIQGTWGGTVSPVAPPRRAKPPPKTQEPPRQKHFMLPIGGGKRDARKAFREEAFRGKTGKGQDKGERAGTGPRYSRPSSADVAREAAIGRWDAALRDHLGAAAYGEAVARVEPWMERVATRAEMRERGAGAGAMLACLSLDGGAAADAADAADERAPPASRANAPPFADTG